jgi:two-component system copper resistance phosphate regulon response regulator CusR
VGVRILVVEDEAAIADFLVRGLREEGFTIEHAADGDAAWQALRGGGWDLVLLDWRIPGPDGAEVLRRFRLREPDTPVLFLTARDAVGDRVRGLNAGADDYLCKPFAFAELLARVRARTRRGRTLPEGSLRHGDLSLDLASHRVERGGRPVELTAREEALLVFFLRHAGEVLTRPRIYQAVWDEFYDGESNTLEVHVMELRRKLEAHGPRVIHTLRGRGYYLGEPTPREAP